MADAGNCRLVVVDADARPLGVVSSPDVVAAVPYAPADDSPLSRSQQPKPRRK